MFDMKPTHFTKSPEFFAAIKYRLFSFIFCLFLLTLVSGKVQAAKLFLTPSSGTYKTGEGFILDLRLNSEGEEINVVDTKLSFPRELIRVSSITREGSILKLWVNDPIFSNNSGTINLVGGIPNGGVIGNGLVARIRSVAVSVGKGSVSLLGSSRVLLNDGLGTEAGLELAGSNLTVVFRPPAEETPTPFVEPTPVPSPEIITKDVTNPEKFKIFLNKHPNIFNNQWFISFYTIDLESGVEHYEVKENKFRFLKRELDMIGGVFKIAESPYLLYDQSLNSKITVRAYDFAGNYTDEVMRPYLKKLMIIWILIALVVATVIIVLHRIIKKIFAKHRAV